MKNSLVIRILSAVVGLGVLSGMYYFFRETGLVILSAIIQVLVVREYVRLNFQLPFEPTFHLVARVGLVLTFLALLFLSDLTGELLGLSFIVLNVTILVTAHRLPLEDVFRRQLNACYGIFYCCLLPLFCVRILQLPMGVWWFLLFLAHVFLGETAAYFTGSAWGRNKLFEKISPGKTVEGAIGGLVLSVLVGALGGYFLNISPVELAIICLFSGACAQMGDLVESQMKRVSNVKDSGNIMPGHGGILDRIDGILFAAPLFYFLVHWRFFDLGT